MTESIRMLETIDRFPLLMDHAANEVSWLMVVCPDETRLTGDSGNSRVANRLL